MTDSIDMERDAVVIEMKNKARERGKKIPPGIYVDFCNEMEAFFLEEAERTLELMEQQEAAREG